MAAPTTYSEATLADYLTTVLGPLAAVLGWDAGSAQVGEAVIDAVLDTGVSGGIASITDIRGLRALGRRAIWRAVVQATASHYSFSSDGQRFDRQQINEQAHKALELAEYDCQVAGIAPDYAVSMVRLSYPHDPYAVIPDEARVP